MRSSSYLIWYSTDVVTECVQMGLRECNKYSKVFNGGLNSSHVTTQLFSDGLLQHTTDRFVTREHGGKRSWPTSDASKSSGISLNFVCGPESHSRHHPSYTNHCLLKPTISDATGTWAVTVAIWSCDVTSSTTPLRAEVRSDSTVPRSSSGTVTCLDPRCLASNPSRITYH